jgi:probable rRNA maturation factor
MAIRIINRQKKIKLDLRKARRSLLRILRELDCSGREINVLFTDDAGIREMNRDYLGRDKPTNVISFSGDREDTCPESEIILGDIVISAETALRDATKGGLSLEHEIDFLMIHGVLHLFGFDHVQSRKEARKMAAKERELFKLLYGFEIN